MTLKKPLTAFHLRLVALIAMLIDHIGKVFLSHLLNASYTVTNAMRAGRTARDVLLVWAHGNEGILWPLYDVTNWIGRMAFPLYCFLIVQGFLHTRSKPKYALRLGILAVLSEIPFDLAFSDTLLEPSHNNVFFTLLLGLLLIWGVSLLEKLCGRLKARWMSLGCLAAGVILLYAASDILMTHLLRSDYSTSGIAVILLMYLLRKRPALSFAAGCIVLAALNLSLVQVMALFALIPVLLYGGGKGPSMKAFFYLFYPVHLLLLVLLRALISI